VGLLLDTNVLVVADGRTPQATPECVDACVDALTATTQDTLWLDLGGEILHEYENNLDRTYPLGLMATFYVELQSNLGVPERCRSAAITYNADRGYEEFPNDPELAAFDRGDRKFVAVSLASGEDPHILNAVDSDWWHHRVALTANGVDVRFVCPDVVASWEQEAEG